MRKGGIGLRVDVHCQQQCEGQADCGAGKAATMTRNEDHVCSGPLRSGDAEENRKAPSGGGCALEDCIRLRLRRATAICGASAERMTFATPCSLDSADSPKKDRANHAHAWIARRFFYGYAYCLAGTLPVISAVAGGTAASTSVSAGTAWAAGLRAPAPAPRPSSRQSAASLSS